MVELLIFHLHIVAAVYAFVKNFQSRTIKDAFLSLGIIALVFAIGWALTGTLAYYIYPKDWNSIYFTSDSLALVLLVIPEVLFFKLFFLQDKPELDTQE
jgi:membrane-bound acyltransferase YfiQ involved in biofilm formation